MYGPPIHIGVATIAAGLGIQLTRDDEPDGDVMEELPAPVGPSIAELAKMVPPPVAGGETLDASRAVIEAMMKGGTS